MDISNGKSPKRRRMSDGAFKELGILLDLDDRNFRRSRAGRLIRDNFRRRDWLKGKRRGKPGVSFK